MNDDGYSIDDIAKHVVRFVVLFVGLLCVIGPLFFLYTLLNGGDQIQEWSRLSIALFSGCIVFFMLLCRVVVDANWVMCITMPLVQVAGLYVLMM